MHVPVDTFKQLRALRPDLVISGELGFRTLFAALFCVRHRRPKLIIWATLSDRTELARGALRRALRAWLLRRADRVIVNGKSGSRYVQRFGVPADRIDVVPYVAAPSFAKVQSSVAREDRIRNLLFVGRLIELKGLARFTAILAAWSQSNPGREVNLMIVGDGPQRSVLEKVPLAGRLSISLLGNCEPHDMPGLFSTADAFVFPTLADEWGVVVNEALAAGLPILGSIHSQAVAELCEEGVTGWLFDPDCNDSTLAAVERALEASGEQLRKMSANARHRVQHLTPEWAAERIVNTLSRALAAT
jgi:hypothetical protein